MIISQLFPQGKFIVELFDKEGGKLLKKFEFPNGITNVGKNYLLDTGFNDGTAVANSAWCIGLIDATGYTAVADADTMASHAGWSEFTSYDEANRVAWGSGAAASQSITNATASTFTINTTGTLKGVFVTSNNTKAGTTGTLWSTALFTGDVAVANGNQLKITYTVSA